MSNLKRRSSCLCGAVSFEVTLCGLDVHVCHCNICQKWSGGPDLSIRCEGDWKIEGEENVTWYDSSEHAQRAFCKKCGSHLFGRSKDGSYHGVMASLDNKEGLKIGEHIFVDKKPDYYDFADDTPRLTEEQFLKMIGAAE